MLVLSDRHDYAAELLPPRAARRLSSTSVLDAIADTLVREFLGGAGVHAADSPDGRWRYLVLSSFSSRSQYDRMIELIRSGRELPDRLVCVAGAGEGFHGSRGRPWTAAAGNLHLTVHFAPERSLERFETAFTVLAALSVVDAIDGVPGLAGRARIKWMNDILLGGEKVAGILAYTQSQETVVSSAVVGIGLNVETAPAVERSPYVPAVGAVLDHASEPATATRRDLLGDLIGALDRNYRTFLDEGYAPLVERYRSRSEVVGRRVVMHEEQGTDPAVIAEGRVTALGDGLELYLEGREEPLTRGRLILEDRRDHDAPKPPFRDSIGAAAAGSSSSDDAAERV